MTAKQDRHFLEAVLEGAEAAIDLATDNEAVKAVPVIGTAFKLARGLDDLRSRLLAAKLARFLTAPSMQLEASKAKMRRKVIESPDEANAVGEALFLVIERLIDMDKPTALAKVYLAYLDNIVSATQLKRLAQAIDLAFGEDLAALLEAQELRLHDDTQPWMVTLEPSGLTQSTVPHAPPGHARIRRSVSPLGEALRAACRHIPNEA